jgi:hypothetical protein
LASCLSSTNGLCFIVVSPLPHGSACNHESSDTRRKAPSKGQVNSPDRRPHLSGNRQIGKPDMPARTGFGTTRCRRRVVSRRIIIDPSDAWQRRPPSDVPAFENWALPARCHKCSANLGRPARTICAGCAEPFFEDGLTAWERYGCAGRLLKCGPNRFQAV